MNYELKKSLLELKNKLLLFSLTGILGTTCAGCSKDSISNRQVVKSIIVDSDNIDTFISELTSDVDEVLDKTSATPYDIIMDLINYGYIEKVYYTTDDINLNIPWYLSNTKTDEIVTLPKLECLEVYGIRDNNCLVKTNEYIGFTTLDNLEELTGTFVVVDISSQEVKLYKDNQVILTSPVVTGRPGANQSDKGLFEIYDITTSRHLIGPGYKSYVDIMMKYNGNEGLHDAEYHTHEDGFKHGWRDASEFGGDTYIKHGSHGCINMLHDDVMTIRDNVDIGTKVLVKE